ncbi:MULTISPECIES: ribbon-helix-helix protein, CopG family [Arthrobacter]|uniref:CopG family transcriptional regulator n=1 Tax=Arthrobacter oryzae TaxID=409290 RepID=A0A3N0C0V3_9MICC|nr:MULTISPECIES: ribbon-helix-helix protein, CopG family [Arthrobacter]QYF90450.1 ribbon-helix-helix domain-containing protein [Arthrobacter sp. PAMC25284]RNL55656.1 CopG family transcriptional regulator [Arthrobacter oryzae]
MSEKKAKGGQDLSLEEQARFHALGEWAETADIGPDARISKASGPGAGRALLEAALGSPEAVKRAVGKPSLSSKGTSPSRTIRLPKDMDAQLLARSEMEHRKPSEILREALAQYLAKAS